MTLGLLCFVAIANDAHAAPGPDNLNAKAPKVIRTVTPAGKACGEPPWDVLINDGPRNVFTPACQFHDRCYWGGTHGFPFMGNRNQCDNAWHNQMLVACRVFTARELLGCNGQANAYFATVRALGWTYWSGNPRDNN